MPLRCATGARYWLSQAGAAVTDGQFSAVSAGVGLVIGFIVLVLTRTPILGLIGLVAGGVVPYGYWSTRRRQLTAARALAWPDALRFVIGALASGTSALHGALVDLAEGRPRASEGAHRPLRQAGGTDRFARCPGSGAPGAR